MSEAGTKVLKIPGGKETRNDKEITIPVVTKGITEDLRQGRAKIKGLRVGLKILDYDPKRDSVPIAGQTPDDKKSQSADTKPEPDGKKPAEPKPVGKKPEPGDKKSDGKNGDERQGDRNGTVKALSADGKSFTLVPAPTEKNATPAAIDIQLTERTRITFGGKAPGQLAVGQVVSVWLAKGSADVAAEVQIAKPPENPEKKPKPEGKGGKSEGKKGVKNVPKLEQPD